MAKTVKTYSEWRQEKLTDPERATRYLNAAYRDSREAFLHAVKNVIQANQVTKIAKEVGVTRESVYRSFSADGNPAFYTIDAVMRKLDIEIGFYPASKTAPPTKHSPERRKRLVALRASASAKRTKLRGLEGSAGAQLSFDFTAPAPGPVVQQSVAHNAFSPGNPYLSPYLSSKLLERNYGYTEAYGR